MSLPLITAHSGCEDTPMDSLASIECGLKLGADAVEMDVRMDRCGALRIAHNVEPTDAEYATHATLQQVFDLLRPTSVLLNLDVKEALHVPAILELAAKNQFSKDRLILSGAISPEQLAKAPELADTAQIFLNLEEILKYFFLQQMEPGDDDAFMTLMTNPWAYIRPRMTEFSDYLPFVVRICKALPIAGLNSPQWYLDEHVFRTLAENDLPLSVWTVDTVEDQSRFMKYTPSSLMNITTRQVKLARKCRQEIRGF